MSFLETIFNRGNFVTLVSLVCITLFIILHIWESGIQKGPDIQDFINTTFEVPDFNRNQKQV